MKKLIALFTIVLTGIGFASCTGTFESTSLVQMSSKQSLATLSYLSSGFLSLEEEPQLQTTKLSVKKQATVNEDQLEEVNKYFSLLKPFISRGPDAFASVEDQASDRPEYNYLLNMSVNDNEFKLYYNVNVQTREITGIFIIDGVEYEIVAHSSLDDFGDFEEVITEEPVTEETTTEAPVTEEATTEAPVTEEATTEASTTLLSEDDDDDEDDEDDEDEFDNEDDDDEDDEDEFDDEDEYDNEEEIEKEMTLVAKNGEDTITIKYEFESEDGESKTEFEILKNINGVETLITVEIEIEEDEYTLAIVDGENVYDFSMETDDDGEIEYELEYEVDGVKVEIEITEYTDENGNVYYEYEYEEEGRQVIIEKDDEFDHDDEDDEDDEDDDDDEDDEDDDEDTEEATI